MIVACIPAYNEEHTIAKVIIETSKHVDKILVCDDGSKDMTSEIAQHLGATVLKHSQNRGKGAALITLFEACKGLHPDAVVTLDADWQHDAKEIPRLVEPIAKGVADIVIGSRFIGSDANTPSYRKIGHRIINSLFKQASGSKVSDTQSGFRAYSSKALETIKLSASGIETDSEILLDATRKGLRIIETPITIRYEGDTSTYNPLSHGYTVASYILQKIVLGRPLLLLGLPGLALLGIGLYLFTVVIDFYIKSKYFSVPFALGSFFFFTIGILTLLTSVMLYAISAILKDARGKTS
jgi:glycosyltransferase involved in cell wall biosynthesis